MNGGIDINNSLSAAMGDIRYFVNQLQEAFERGDNTMAAAVQTSIDTAITSAISIMTPIDSGKPDA